MNTFEQQFDFDEMVRLANTDPIAFERRRVELIEQTCVHLGGHDKPNIAGLLCRIELERRRCKTPLKCCINLSRLMWERFLDLNDALQGRPSGTPKVVGIEAVRVLTHG